MKLTGTNRSMTRLGIVPSGKRQTIPLAVCGWSSGIPGREAIRGASAAETASSLMKTRLIRRISLFTQTTAPEFHGAVWPAWWP